MSWIYDGKTYPTAREAAKALAQEHGDTSSHYDIWRGRLCVYGGKGLITLRKFSTRADGAHVIAPITTTEGKTDES